MILDAHERSVTLAERWDSLRVFTPARYAGLPGWAFPAKAWAYPDQGRGGRLPRGLRRPLRAPVRRRRGERLSREGDRYVLTVVTPARGRERHRRDGPVPRPRDSGRSRASSTSDPAAALARLPGSIAAAGGRRLVVGSRQLRADCARSVARARPAVGRHPVSEPVAPATGCRRFTPPIWFDHCGRHSATRSGSSVGPSSTRTAPSNGCGWFEAFDA